VTADQIDPDTLHIETHVNGEKRQSGDTGDFIHNTRKMISYIAGRMTLRAGDVIYTGTPAGVIAGKPKDQQVWLKPGDKIVSTISKLGELKFDLA
jgi:2-keto-4-pentenoate hydratase/2-oxohepta-3-ene-1,7-dioic acid hydratase in catechol pathway